jgi:dihydrofolate reductase
MKDCKFILIAAVSVDGIIGIDNEIPWRIPEDFKHFRNTTMGNMLLVGYNTYKTLPAKAFEGREYMVVHGDNPIEYDKNPDIYHFSDLDTILYLLRDEKTDIEKIFVAGGAMVYDSLIDECDECIITWVNKTYPNGNKRFPIDKLFANFEVYSDQDWQKSTTGVLYKVTYYKK